MRALVSTNKSRRKSKSAEIPTATDVLCAHAARTLPDSLTERKQILRALHRIVRADHPVSLDLQAQLSALAAVEQLDAQLRQHFTGQQP